MLIGGSLILVVYLWALLLNCAAGDEGCNGNYYPSIALNESAGRRGAKSLLTKNPHTLQTLTFLANFSLRKGHPQKCDEKNKHFLDFSKKTKGNKLSGVTRKNEQCLILYLVALPSPLPMRACICISHQKKRIDLV